MKFKKIIPYSRQSISSSDILKVNHVLKSDYLTQGNFVINLEKNLNKIVRAKYCILTNSGTSALHLSCLSLNLKKKRYSMDSTKYFCSNCKRTLIMWGKN